MQHLVCTIDSHEPWLVDPTLDIARRYEASAGRKNQHPLLDGQLSSICQGLSAGQRHQRK